MKIEKLPNLFEIYFKKAKQKEILEFLKMCFKYRKRLFSEDFFKENFSSADKFLKFISNCAQNVFCVRLGKNPLPTAFFYIYDIKKGINNIKDCKITYCVKRAYWGFGSYFIAKKAIEFLFKEKNIRKLSAEIVGENSLATLLLGRLGFELEAKLKDEYCTLDETKNVYIYSKFNPACKQ